ncbi:MAG: aryl-alcohol dehydrogenase-like predicted oxidoreductase [Parasphingorhabdus sp.]|jgi:aryl-alcohol dehydrogenase-like predicted oxidoreductase
MKFNQLGNSEIQVSEICLGSMTWGTQNTEQEGHSQINLALEQGVNFIDSAEMYPTNPLSADHAGATESVIGSWFAKTGRRSDVILATKVSGSGSKVVRQGAPISSQTIRTAVEGSLERLQTDYLDLYQLHWPNRGSYHFRQSWKFNPTSQDVEQTKEHMLDVLKVMQELVNEGKVRTIGLSNESCWGTAKFLSLAESMNLPRVVSVQNEYSLLDRKFDLDLAELSHNEKVGLLAFSPLAAGILSGKYQGDKTPAGSRRTFSENLGGRYSPHVVPVVDKYLQVAERYQLDPCQMSVAFCCSRPFMTSAIIGAVSEQQLTNSIKSCELNLSDEILTDLNDVHRQYPNPMG